MLEKLLTKNGDAGIAIIIIMGMVIVFVCLPIIAVTFERSMLRIAFQEISDLLEIGFYQLYSHMDVVSLSHGTVTLDQKFLDDLNDYLHSHIGHPQIANLNVMSYRTEVNGHALIIFDVEMTLKPTLYRSFWKIVNDHSFKYQLSVPLDKKGS